MSFFLSLVTLVAIFPFCSRSQNPVSPPGVYIADPTARVMPDGKVYIYGSNDESPDHYCSKVYHVLSSPDLVNWTLTRNTFASAGPGDQVSYSDDYLFAPDCVYRNGLYYLYYCLAGTKDNEGVATSKSPTGPFVNGQLVKGVTGIDPALFIDTDGQVYYYWGQFSAMGAKLKKDMISVDESTITKGLVTEKDHRFHEGGWVFKRNGIYYYVYTSLSPRGEATTIGYSTSKSPLGPFKYGGTIIDNLGCDPKTWNNHGSVFEFKGQWYVFYHRSTHSSLTMRKACIEKITFNKDGSINPVEMTSQGAGKPLDPFKVIPAERACLMSGNVRIVQSGSDNEVLAKIKNYDSSVFKYLNFNRVPRKITVSAAGKAGGKIIVYTNDMFRPHGTIEIPKGDGTTFHEYSAEVKNIPQGETPLRLRYVGEEGPELMDVDQLVFE